MADSLPQGFELDHAPLPEGFSLDPPSVPGTAEQGAFEAILKNLLPGAPDSVHNALIGLTQGIRELGHGTAERVERLATLGVGPLHALDPSLNQDVADNIASMQAQEQAFNQAHPDSIIPGVDSPEALKLGRGAAHLIPFLASRGVLGATAAGATQPMAPGENPFTSPALSGVGTVALGIPVAVLNKTITKAYNAGALKDTIDAIGVPKADLNKQGAYQAIKQFAETADSLPPGSPALKQAGKAKAFVNTIENLSPSAAVALRSDVGAQYLKHAVQSSELYATRDALGAKLGPLDTKPLLQQLQGLLQTPEMQAVLNGQGAAANRAVNVVEGGAAPENAFGAINLENQPDSVKAAFGLLMNPAAKVDYATLSTVRSNLDAAGSALRGQPSSIFYKQASKLVDDFQKQVAENAGGELNSADRMARAYYKNNVVPYLEKGLAQKLSDPTKLESKKLYEMFSDYADRNPERAERLYRMISPDGKAAVRGGYISDMLSANTDRAGYIDPVGIRDFLEKTGTTANRYLVSPEDKQLISGITNLIDAHATMSGRTAETYQKYLMARGSENIFLGEFAKGAQQITMPFYYNWLYKAFYNNQQIKRFVIASSKLNPDSPEAARAVIKFTRMLQQAGVGELSQSDTAKQAVDQTLNMGEQ